MAYRIAAQLDVGEAQVVQEARDHGHAAPVPVVHRARVLEGHEGIQAAGHRDADDRRDRRRQLLRRLPESRA